MFEYVSFVCMYRCVSLFDIVGLSEADFFTQIFSYVVVKLIKI